MLKYSNYQSFSCSKIISFGSKIKATLTLPRKKITVKTIVFCIPPLNVSYSIKFFAAEYS